MAEMVFLLVGAGLAAPGEAATAGDKQAFLEQEKFYLTFEITETETREFGTGTPADAVTDRAHRLNRRVKFEVPLDMAIPGSFPPSSLPLSQTEMMEQDRFIGWMAVPPDDPTLEDQLTSGKLNMAASPMLLPVEFSVDDTIRLRHRDRPSDGWGTETTTVKGRGIVYGARSGMLICDLKKMTCDIANVAMGYNEDTDLVTINTTSDVPGFEPKHRTESPRLHLPQPGESLLKKLSAFSITLPDPITLTFTGSPMSPQVRDGEGATITMKITISSKSMGKVPEGPK